MNTDKSNVIAQGYVDPNRKDQGHSLAPEVLNPAIRTFANLGNGLGGIRMTGDREENRKKIQTLLNNTKEIQMQAEVLSPEIEPSNSNLTFDEKGNVTGLGLGVDVQKIPSAHISGAVLDENTVRYARGESPVIAHIDELPYYKEAKGEVVVPSNERDYFNAWTKGEDLGPVGPVGELGLKGPDDSGLAADYDGNVQRRKPKRSGSKKKSKHLPNMKSRVVKAALGSAILGKLGKIQRDTTDAVKRDILKDVPLSGFVEAVTGKTLPDYQKRLLDLQQARSEGTLKPEIAEVLGDKPAKLEVAE